MAKRKFKTRRIPPPSWGYTAPVKLRDVTQSEYELIMQHRHAMVAAADEEVSRYLNDDRLVFHNDDDGFPNLSRMTGEYYISSETVKAAAVDNHRCYQISVKTRFVEKLADSSDDPLIGSDYLGLDVWLICDPQDWRFRVYRNTDSSSI